MKQITLPSGETAPALGQGTWFMGDNPARRDTEIAALRHGIEQGAALIDTAEMYGNGRAEALVGAALEGCRDDVFLVSKILPGNAGGHRAMAACEASLRRLGTDHLDLYLLHWQGSLPFEDTLAAFERLQAEGKIRHFGVSNLDFQATRAFHALAGGGMLQVNQLLYNLRQRGIEWDLLPWLQNHGITTMAYSPFDHGDLVEHDGLAAFAHERGMTPAQAALTWLMAHEGVLPIPKSSTPERAAENAAACEIILDADDHAVLDTLFAPVPGPRPLQIY